MEITNQIEAKRQAWGEMGIQVANVEIQLQARKEEIKLSLLVPTNIDEIQAAESTLKLAKQKANEIVTDRKKYTSKFDDVAARLMAPEKELIEVIKAYEASIISIKKAHEIEMQKIKQVEDAKAYIKKIALENLLNIESSCKNFIIELVKKSYEFALNKGIEIAKIEDYKKTVIVNGIKKLDEYYSKEHLPKVTPSALISFDESEIIWNDNFIFSIKDYYEIFKDAITVRFSDYEIAFENKERALQIAKEEAELAAIEQAKQKEQQEAMNALTSSAEVMVTSNVKQLKKSFEVDMPDTPESMLTIFAAFAANKSECISKTSTKKWLSFTADSAAKTLAKLKSENNSLEFKGITFKEVDKL